MSTVRLTSRPGGNDAAVCPYCRDSVGVGPRVDCPACGARYHDECGSTFGRCAAMACGGVLAVARASVALPRIASFARRLRSWAAAGASADELETWALYILPASREVQRDDRVARVLGEVLGQTALDARLRLGVPYPELVSRVPQRDEAERQLRALREVGLDARRIGMGELLRPLEPFQAKQLVVGDVLAFSDAGGALRIVARDVPRLLLPTSLVSTQLSKMKVEKAISGGSHYGPGRTRMTTIQRKDRRVERALFVALASDGPPVLLGDDLTVEGLGPTPSTSHLRYERLLEAVRGPRSQERSDLQEVRLPTLQVPEDLLSHVLSNRHPLVLMARLVVHAWREDLDAKG